MGCRNGRRARKRRRKQESGQKAVPLCHQHCYVELAKWLKQRGFTCKHLIPAMFTDTGRGLLTTQHIKAGEVLISLPESCLLTTSTVLNSYMGVYIRRWKPPISPLLALCTFLISERHGCGKCEWKPYVDVLPTRYTCAVCYCDDVRDLLPAGVRREALEQRLAVDRLYTSSKPFITSLQPLYTQSVEEIFTQDALLWAWCSVQTRTVYVQQPPDPHLSQQADVYALAPYLDLLNHGAHVQVEGSFSSSSRSYHIRSVNGCTKYQQAFICYGPRDNQRLLLDYGFIAPANPHSVVYVEPELLYDCHTQADKQLPQKMQFLKQNKFAENLTFGLDGPSWRLMVVSRLLSLKAEQYACWKSVLLGSPVTFDTQQLSKRLAQSVCQRLMQESVEALRRICVMRDGADGVLMEHLDVVEKLREEEQNILSHCLPLIEG